MRLDTDPLTSERRMCWLSLSEISVGSIVNAVRMRLLPANLAIMDNARKLHNKHSSRCCRTLSSYFQAPRSP